MIKMLIKYFLSFCLFGLGFGQVDYSEIQTIFTNNCGDCHLSGSSGGLNLSSYTDLMSGSSEGAVVIPYDHDASAIYDRITREESATGDMPPAGSLSQDEIDLIAQWIDEGALEEPGSSSGCTDSQAYNCADDDGVNYTFEVGPITYVNGCNYELDDFLNLVETTDNNCEDGPCEGYYNPGATEDDGSCDYYQAPHGDDVEFTVEENGINIDWISWANNITPDNAVTIAYHVQRCTDQCLFITEYDNPPQNTPYNCWPDCPYPHTDTFIFDEFEWESGIEIKYAINVQYSNAEAYGMAIGASYVTPGSCPNMGDMNDDGGWNVLDIVTLANCVLAGDCADLENGCAGDMNDDGGWNVLDIVTLANCVLAGDCG